MITSMSEGRPISTDAPSETTASDPDAVLELLTHVRTDSLAWSQQLWPLAQGAADAGLADEVLTMPPEVDLLRFGGEHLAYALLDASTHAVEFESGQIVAPPHDAMRSRLSDDLRRALVISDGALRIVEGDAERVVAERGCTAALWTAGSASFAATCAGEGRVWLGDGTLVRSRPVEGVLARVDADGTRLLTSSATHEWRLYDLDGGEPSVVRTGPGKLLAFDPLRATLVLRREHGIAIVALADAALRELEIAGDVLAAAIDPQGRQLAIGTGSGELWWVALDDPAAAPVRARELQGDPIEQLDWSPDGRDVVSVAGGRAANVWDVLGRRVRASVRGKETIRDARWLDDGRLETLSARAIRRSKIGGARTLARDVAGFAGCGDSTVVAGKDGRVVRHRGDEQLTLHDGEAGVLALGVAPDCSAVATLREHGVEVVGLDRELAPRTIPFARRVFDFAVTADAQRLLWVEDCKLFAQDLAGGEARELAASAPGHCFDVMELQGDTVLLGEPPEQGFAERIRVFDSVDGHERAPVVPGFGFGKFLPLPGGHGIAIAGEQGVVVVDGDDRRVLSKPGNIVIAMAASADGQWLAALPLREPVRVWHLPTGMEYDAPFTEPAFDPEGLEVWRLGPIAFIGEHSLAVADVSRSMHVLELAVPTDGAALKRWVMNSMPERRTATVR